MQPISPLVRLTLGALAAGLATLMAPDVFGILPTWAQVVIGFVSAVVAFLLLPVNWQPNGDKTRATKRGTDTRRSTSLRTRRSDTTVPVGQTKPRSRLNRMAAVAALALFALPAFAPTSADAYLHVANAQAACGPTAAPYFDAWSKQWIGPGNILGHAYGNFYYRINDNAVIVDCVIRGNYPYSPWSQGEVRSYISGNDGSESITFSGGYPDWRYLGQEPTYLSPPNGCGGTPNWGGYCIMGNFPYGF